MSDQGKEEDLPTTRHSMVTTIANVGEDKKFRSVVEEKEVGEMNEVVMEEVDMQLGGMMGGKQSLVGTEKKRSELQEAPEFLVQNSAPDDEGEDYTEDNGEDDIGEEEELLSDENSDDGRLSRKQNVRTEFDLKEYCGLLYDHAGSLVKEPEEQITLEKYPHQVQLCQGCSVVSIVAKQGSRMAGS